MIKSLILSAALLTAGTALSLLPAEPVIARTAAAASDFGGRPAIRHDPRLRRAGRLRPFRRQPRGHLRRHHLQAGRVHRHPDAQQHHVAAGADAGGHRVGVRLQDAGALALRRRAHWLPGAATWMRQSTAARHAGADVLVKTFPDPIGRDVVIQWPGGVDMQLYWHTTRAVLPAAADHSREPRLPLGRPGRRLHAQLPGLLRTARWSPTTRSAPGVEIGRPGDTYRRIRIDVELRQAHRAGDRRPPALALRSRDDRLRGRRSGGHAGQGARRPAPRCWSSHMRGDRRARRWCNSRADTSPRFTRRQSVAPR